MKCTVQKLFTVSFLLLAIYLGLFGCQQSPTVTPVVTSVHSATVAPTVTATPATLEWKVLTPKNITDITAIGHWGQGVVYGIALSPDGETIAVVTATGVYLYDRATLDQTGYLDVKISPQQREDQACFPSGNLAFSPDSSTLAISNMDILLWDVKTKSVRAVLPNGITEPSSMITSIRYSADGSRIMGVQKHIVGYPCYSGWGSLVIYDTNNGKLIFQHEYSRYEEGPVLAFAEKDGRALMSFLDMNKQGHFLFEVNLRDGKIIHETEAPPISSMNSHAALAYRWINAGNASNGYGYSQTQLLELSSLEVIESMDTANTMLISNTDRIILRKEQEMEVRTLDGDEICTGEVYSSEATAFLPEVFSADGSIGVSWNSYGFRAGDIHIWDLINCHISKTVLTFPEAARNLSISADGQSVLTGSRAGYTFHLFDVATGEMRFSVSGFDAAFSADGTQVFVVEAEGIAAYDAQTGAHIRSILKAEFNYMSDIIVSPDGKFIAVDNTAGNGYQLFRLDDTKDASRAFSLDARPHFSADGKLISMITSKPALSSLRFWNLETATELTQWQGLVVNNGFYSLAFNSDFSKIATADTDGYNRYIYLWDIPAFSLSTALMQTYPNNDRQIKDFVFLFEDQMVFARGVNPDALLFWDTQTGTLLHELMIDILDSELGNPVVLSPDGRLVLMLDGDGTIHVWGVPSRDQKR